MLVTQKYRPVVTIGPSLDDALSVVFRLYLDSFFKTQEEAYLAARNYVYELVMKNGKAQLVLRDSQNKVVGKISRNQIIKYDCELNGVNCTYAFEELFRLLNRSHALGIVRFEPIEITIERISLRETEESD